MNLWLQHCSFFRTSYKISYKSYLIFSLFYLKISNPVKWEQILNTFYLDENLKTADEEELESKKSNEDEEEETEKKKPTHSKKSNEEEEEESEKRKPKQSPDRIYPDIYECGPASQTGPILKVINRKAHQFYKHIEV